MSNVHCRASPGARYRPAGNGETRPTTAFWALTLGSIGVVYGDIGTSPLYALREAVTAAVGAGERGDASRRCSASCR